LEAHEAPFDRVYFDSSTFRDGGWPHVSGILEDTFRLAQELKISLFVPDAVEIELESLWLRELHELRNEQKMTKHISGITANLIAPIDWEQMRGAYRASTSALKTQWAIVAIPVTQATLKHAFQLTIAPGPPFENRRPGLRDATIYYSIVEHLRTDTGHRAVFVTEDKDLAGFLDEQETSRLRGFGVALQIPRSHENKRALDWLRSKLHGIKEAQETAAERALREEDVKRAIRALEAQWSNLEEFVQNNLQYPIWAFAASIDTILGIEVGNLGAVTVSRSSVPGSPQFVKILAEVQVAIHALARPLSLPSLMRSVHEEEKPLAAWARPRSEYASGAAAIVEANALQDGTEFRIVEFISAVVREART
jgi:hypothetical protein